MGSERVPPSPPDFPSAGSCTERMEAVMEGKTESVTKKTQNIDTPSYRIKSEYGQWHCPAGLRTVCFLTFLTFRSTTLSAGREDFAREEAEVAAVERTTRR